MNRFLATIYCNLSFFPQTRKKCRIRLGPKAGGKGYVNPEGNRIFLIPPSGEKQLVEPYQTPASVRLNIQGEHNTLIFHAPLSLNSISIHIWKHARGVKIEFGSSVSEHSHWNNASIVAAASGSALSLGHSTSIERLTVVLVSGQCHIGNDCMLSSGITIWAKDSHRLMDADTGALLNGQPQGVFIGDHCWIGQGAAFTKRERWSKAARHVPPQLHGLNRLRMPGRVPQYRTQRCPALPSSMLFPSRRITREALGRRILGFQYGADPLILPGHES